MIAQDTNTPEEGLPSEQQNSTLSSPSVASPNDTTQLMAAIPAPSPQKDSSILESLPQRPWSSSETPVSAESTGNEVVSRQEEQSHGQALTTSSVIGIVRSSSDTVVESHLKEPSVPLLRQQPRQWEEHEPIDLSFPVKHVHAHDLDGVNRWRISGVSRRGKMHAHEAKYREDAWMAKLSRHKGWCIIAVADGGGSYELARVGSHVATQAAVDSLVAKLPEQEFLDSAIRGAMSEALTDAYEALEKRAGKISAGERPNTTSRDLSTTLLLFAFCPRERKLIVAQIGDGLIALQKADGTYVKLADGDAGEVAGATMFLNNVKNNQWTNRIRLFNLHEIPRLLVAMTDGLSDDVFESEQQNIHTLFDALAHFTDEQKPSQAIYDWLGYDKRGSFDDRTLVVLYPEH